MFTSDRLLLRPFPRGQEDSRQSSSLRFGYACQASQIDRVIATDRHHHSIRSQVFGRNHAYQIAAEELYLSCPSTHVENQRPITVAVC